MSDNTDSQAFDEAPSTEDTYRAPSPALSIYALVASIAGGVIGYFANWPIGVVLVVSSIITGVLARKRHAPYRWAATLGIAISTVCLAICVVVVSIVMYQAQQMTNLLAQ